MRLLIRAPASFASDPCGIGVAEGRSLILGCRGKWIRFRRTSVRLKTAQSFLPSHSQKDGPKPCNRAFNCPEKDTTCQYWHIDEATYTSALQSAKELDVCGSCRLPYGGPRQRLPCDHAFCPACVDNAARNLPECPLCRLRFRPESLPAAAPPSPSLAAMEADSPATAMTAAADEAVSSADEVPAAPAAASPAPTALADAVAAGALPEEGGGPVPAAIATPRPRRALGIFNRPPAQGGLPSTPDSSVR